MLCWVQNMVQASAAVADVAMEQLGHPPRLSGDDGVEDGAMLGQREGHGGFVMDVGMAPEQ